MKTTTRDIERQIGELRREIDATVRCIEQDEVWMERWACVQGRGALARERGKSLVIRRQVLSPLFAKLHALEARLPAEPVTKPVTIEALFCLLDQVEPDQREMGRRGVSSLMGAWTA
jgi:hypothetical protein